jgi:CheY-like chemotaxis protein
MDIQMPIMDGYEATRQLRKRYDADTLPIVAMTANAMASDRREALDVGMNDHVSKPFNSSDLIRTILKYVNGQQESNLIHDGLTNMDSSIKEASETDDTCFMPHSALARLGDNQAIFQSALQAYLGDSVELMGGFVTELDKTNIKSMAILAHTFKGVSATVGADKLANVLKQLEVQLRKGETENYQSLLEQVHNSYRETITAIESYLKENAACKILDVGNVHRQLRDESLFELKTLLELSNMKALTLYDELVRLDDRKSEQSLLEMKPFIEKLSFQEALQWLDKYMASRREA